MPVTDSGQPDRPFVAGMYDYYLGGTANSAADRAAVDQITAVLPEIPEGAWANRGFLQRAVTRLVRDWGIRQFLDIGAGLPTQRNTHDVVRDTVPAGEKWSVVYVDIDPQVIVRGTELLADTPGAAVIQGDVREPDVLLAHPTVREKIDFSQPACLMLIAVLPFVVDDDEAYAVVRRYVDALAPGSYVMLSALTADHQSERLRDLLKSVYARTPTPVKERTKAQISRFLDGLEIIPPYEGAKPEIDFVGNWGAEDLVAADDDGARWGYAAVARKPGPA
jgi:hypothetical protein